MRMDGLEVCRGFDRHRRSDFVVVGKPSISDSESAERRPRKDQSNDLGEILEVQIYENDSDRDL